MSQKQCLTDYYLNAKTYCPSKAEGGFSLVLKGCVVFVRFEKLVLLFRSMSQRSTSGFGEPGVGYLMVLEGGKVPLFVATVGIPPNPFWPI